MYLHVGQKGMKLNCPCLYKKEVWLKAQLGSQRMELELERKLSSSQKNERTPNRKGLLLGLLI